IFEEFGYFDEVYGHGYNEENDLIMRANRCGFRAALANHAFVYHMGEASFSKTTSAKSILEERNAEILSTRYPEYDWAVRTYMSSPTQEAEQVFVGLLRDREGKHDLAFDFSSVGAYHNGTFEYAKEILRRAPSQWSGFNVHVVASEETRRFH